MTDREIVTKLATEVMGWKVETRGPDTLYFSRPDTIWTHIWNAEICEKEPRRSDLWSPLTSISDAFMIVEKMRERGWWMRIETPFRSNAPFSVGVCPLETTGWNGRMDRYVMDFSASRAICLAALAAVTEGK